jgi:hypothetical protein
MAAIWAGIDAGKTHHHCVANDEPELLELLADVMDLADGGAALAIATLLNHGQPGHCISGRAIHRAPPRATTAKTKPDAEDTAVIADQVRIRRDLCPLRVGDATALGLLTSLGLQRARVRAFVLRADELRSAGSAYRQLSMDPADARARAVEAAADRARRRFGPEAVRPAALAD